MPRADEPRVMVRLSAGLAAELDRVARLYDVKVPAVIREACALAGEQGAALAAGKKAAKREVSAASRKMPRAPSSRSRPGGGASTSAAAPPFSPAPAAAVDRADVFRVAEERRRALRG